MSHCNTCNASHKNAVERRHPDARQMPQCFVMGQRVGGLAGLQAALKEMGL